MQTLLIIVWIVSAIFGVASWVVCSFWIAGTPRSPWFPLSFMGQYWIYRRAQKAVAAGEIELRHFRLYSILFGAALASFSAALFLSVIAVLMRG